jgi:hypothetical protein
MGKPELHIISMSTELQELIGQQSWLVLKVAKVDREDVKNWIIGEASQSFGALKRLSGRTHVLKTVLNATFA